VSGPEPDGSDDFDEVVDLICVGTGSGAIACVIACETEDFEVLHAIAPENYDPATAEYLAQMTTDLGDGFFDGEPAPTRAVPERLARTAGRPRHSEPFCGERLRRWSERCLASPSGVLFTAVSGLGKRMRTDSGEIITATVVDPAGQTGAPAETFAGLIYQEGLIAGALLDGATGRRRVRAGAGLAFALGPGGPWPRPAPPGVIALVGRPAGRFARLEALETPDGCDGE
jgi:hypothetical protein